MDSATNDAISKHLENVLSELHTMRVRADRALVAKARKDLWSVVERCSENVPLLLEILAECEGMLAESLEGAPNA